MQTLVKVIWFTITAILALYCIFNEILLGLGIVLFINILGYWMIEMYFKKEDMIRGEKKFSLIFNSFIVMAGIILFFVFLYKDFDIYLCLIPLAVLFCGAVSLYVDLKMR